jgi:hypothetical protein
MTFATRRLFAPLLLCRDPKRLRDRVVDDLVTSANGVFAGLNCCFLIPDLVGDAEIVSSLRKLNTHPVHAVRVMSSALLAHEGHAEAVQHLADCARKTHPVLHIEQNDTERDEIGFLRELIVSSGQISLRSVAEVMWQECRRADGNAVIELLARSADSLPRSGLEAASARGGPTALKAAYLLASWGGAAAVAEVFVDALQKVELSQGDDRLLELAVIGLYRLDPAKCCAMVRGRAEAGSAQPPGDSLRSLRSICGTGHRTDALRRLVSESFAVGGDGSERSPLLSYRLTMGSALPQFGTLPDLLHELRNAALVDVLVAQQKAALVRSIGSDSLDLAVLRRIGLRGATALPFVAARYESEIELRVSPELVENAATRWIAEPARFGRGVMHYN